jgi:hypothetical protein
MTVTVQASNFDEVVMKSDKPVARFLGCLVRTVPHGRSDC